MNGDKRKNLGLFFGDIFLFVAAAIIILCTPSLLVVADLKGGKYESKNVEEIR